MVGKQRLLPYVSPFGSLPVPSFDTGFDTSGPSVVKEVYRRLTEGAVRKREELAARMLEKGMTPDNGWAISERIEFDDQRLELKYVCFPVWIWQR